MKRRTRSMVRMFRDVGPSRKKPYLRGELAAIHKKWRRKGFKPKYTKLTDQWSWVGR